MSKNNPFKKNRLEPKSLLVAGIVLVGIIFISLLIFGGSSDKEIITAETQEVADVPVLGEAAEPAPVTPPISTSKSKQLTTMCEDYTFKQGTTAELDGHSITIDRIGTSGVLLTVDKESFLLSEDDVHRVDDFLIELDAGDILYFVGDDSDNAVKLRLGCTTKGEDPNDKYVREKGTTVCEDLFKSCQEQFGIEEE